MAVKFTNNAATTLSGSISSSATSFSVASASGFPTLGGSDWTYVTIDSEVVKVTAISGTTFTCVATSSSHSSGDNVELRMTAELLNDFAEDTEALPLAGGTMTGNIVMSGSETVDGRDLSADGTKLDGIAASANNYVHPNHTGDVTSSADGAQTIADDAVTYAKMQNVAADERILGRVSGANGVVEELTKAQTLTMLNVEDGATADQSNAEIVAAVEAGTDSNTFTDADHSKLNAIAASANNYVHPNHTGEVTSSADGATVVADDVIDEANLKVSNAPVNGYVLTAQSGNTGGLTWAADSTTDSTKLPLAGGTMTGNILGGDNVYLFLGAGNDLQLHHDGSNSYIVDDGTGDLILRGTSNIKLQNGTGESMLTATSDGSIELYENNVKKLETSANGITVTGTAVATTSTAGSQTGNVTLDFAANQNFVLTMTGNVTLVNPTTEQVGQSGFIAFIQDGTGSRLLSTLQSDYETAGGSGITLSTAANTTDIVPYLVVASGRVLLGTPQLAFA